MAAGACVFKVCSVYSSVYCSVCSVFCSLFASTNASFQAQRPGEMLGKAWGWADPRSQCSRPRVSLHVPSPGPDLQGNAGGAGTRKKAAGAGNCGYGQGLGGGLGCLVASPQGWQGPLWPLEPPCWEG